MIQISKNQAARRASGLLTRSASLSIDLALELVTDIGNQTASNACASVALLNIVNNIKGIDLGENLRSFKDFTMPFTPALRGDAISNFEFATSKRSRPVKNKPADNKADASFHFIAFVPALGKVWKFDGLERQPQALDWLSLVKPDIRTRMEAYEEDQIEFSILSVARDPLPELVDQLATNVKSLEIIQERLSSIHESSIDLESTLADSVSENTILGPDESYTLTRESIDQVTVHKTQEREYQTCSVEELIHHRQRLGHAQQDLRAAIREEQQSQQVDEDYAEGRRYDYGPAIRTWLRFLARKRLIEDLL
ncbi:hypothetical protein ASPNIDRAFT_178797 [Aspergillus niger ATCC 1015]|uniref:ubiquitinyl hydrolase 1 n=1 Tax=Aspergillus niger (strain ATCC 1015 / CBS 113.46 / FGSC A1144 / LSHB Ac4 / NCTC 3858a / NRRL 328 / USDA 3528.7) TaxID=380704 RepID=G3YC80_ASPNA|nr:hypothetical protein ASPNIDRAFT_178797 [Aspergillus niger ATCC 1015]